MAEPGPRFARRSGYLLALILLAYLGLGGAYALNTPLWQAPDEPAHFNYIRHLAQGQGLPVLQIGDYDFDYLERIKAARFPPEMSIVPIRYESHQPPLYYLLEAPIFLSTQGWPFLKKGWPLAQQVLPLRLFSLLLGALLLVTVYRAVGQIFPREPTLSLGATALVAFIPQHLHIAGSINNDVLGELLLSMIMLLLLLRMHPSSQVSPRGTGLLGAALGLALLAKDTAAVAVPLVALGLYLGGRLKGGLPWARLALTVAGVYGVALAVSGWWFLRNTLVYGDLDLLGLARHGQVVVGQPRLEVLDWEAAARFGTVGFQSFWAQFGWMGVPSDSRTYVFAGLLSLLAVAGLALFLAQGVRRTALSPYQRAALVFLGVAFLLVLAGVVRYNLEFIQPQGRYLYPALLPISLFAFLGWQELMGKHPALPTALLALSLLGLAAYNLWRVLIPGLR